MPDIALPIKIADLRFEKSPIKMLSGLSVRLDEDKRENLEDGFPGSGEIAVERQKMDYSIYAFKSGKRDTYAGNEGIIFTVNGQVHGFLPKNFFERTDVKMGYISDSILVIINCSKVDRGMQEKLFMNSRDRLAGGPLQSDIERHLEDVIKNHEGLRALREKRRREDVENRLQDSKPLADVLENIIKKSPSLSSLFMQGIRIKNPFNLMGATEFGEFKGKTFPTYFTPAKEYSKEKPKVCPINRKFRIQYETDANNDYFNRDKEPGELTLAVNNAPIEDYSLNLWNGLATLTIGLPDNTKVGDILSFQTSVIDLTRVDAIASEFCVKVEEPETKTNGHKKGERKDSSSEEKGVARQKPSYLDIPNAIEVRRAEWSRSEEHTSELQSQFHLVCRLLL